MADLIIRESRGSFRDTWRSWHVVSANLPAHRAIGEVRCGAVAQRRRAFKMQHQVVSAGTLWRHRALVREVVRRGIAFQGKWREYIGLAIWSAYAHHQASDAIRREPPGLPEQYVIEAETAGKSAENR